ncbi:MAG: glycosyltransferase family 39 protein [Bacteroidales bacterium]|nr:glycosyltransferase family 39 protein [Bacteroidales bacterium]
MNSVSPAPMVTNQYKRTFLVLIFIWFLANLIQAFFMEVMSDEAYYGMYGKYLAWGYFDHPPMVALMVRISSFFFSGNLGIRFMTVLLQVGTLILIWKTLSIEKPDSKSVVIFFIVAASISLFSFYGVLTAPDAPLLFFTALFLLAYKRFIKSPDWIVVVLLSVSMAGMIYSKYQAILVIGFTILSNLKLLRSFRFWLAGISGLIILFPHFHWQITNNFPSLQYHLVDRTEGFKWTYLLEYFPNQLAVFNPLTLGAVLWIMIKNKPAGQFEKTLWWQIAGFMIFFFLIAFRGHVEPHWTIACSIPIIIILAERSSRDPVLYRYTRKFILPTLLIFAAVRLLVMTDIRFVRYLAFGGKQEKYEVLESEAGDLPVVFTGAFQRPALYTFFTGKQAVAVSSLYSRQTQYDIWQFEKKYHNKPAFISSNPKGNSQIYPSDSEQFGGFRTESLQTVNRMKINFDLNGKELHSGDSINISFTLKNEYDFDIDFNHEDFPVELCMVFIKGQKIEILDVFPSEEIEIISAGETITGNISADIPVLDIGNYSFGLSLNNFFGPSFNSPFVRIKIMNDD